MIKAILVKRLILTSPKSKKKLRILANISIFLTIVVIVSSFISIYFENKLTKHRFDLSNLQYEEYKIQEWLNNTAIRNSQNRDGKFIHYITNETTTIKITKSRYYFLLLQWYPWVLEWALEDAKKIGTEELRTKYKISEKINKTKEIGDYVLKTRDKIYIHSDNTDLLYDYKLEEEFWKKNDKDELFEYLDIAERYIFEINLYFTEYNNIADKRKTELNKKIIILTDKSNDLIFYAFIVQLLIFVTLQIFELRELK